MEQRRQAEERKSEEEARGRTDALRTELAEVARVADPILRAWVRGDRFRLALSATPGARGIGLAPLHITPGTREPPRFSRERGGGAAGTGAQVLRRRDRTSPDVPLGRRGAGRRRGGDVPVRPRSFGALARLDLRSRVGWPGHEHDVLGVALRVAQVVANGELEQVVARTFQLRARGLLP